MPTYGYQCTECKHEFSIFQNMKDDPIAVCPQCAGKVKRLLYPVGIVFKGTGWYINDSRAPEKSEKSEGSDKGDKGDKKEKTDPVAASSESSGETTAPAPTQESKSESTPVPAAATTPAPTK